jgi:hypothetical protein
MVIVYVNDEKETMKEKGKGDREQQTAPEKERESEAEKRREEVSEWVRESEEKREKKSLWKRGSGRERERKEGRRWRWSTDQRERLAMKRGRVGGVTEGEGGREREEETFAVYLRGGEWYIRRRKEGFEDEREREVWWEREALRRVCQCSESNTGKEDKEKHGTHTHTDGDRDEKEGMAEKKSEGNEMEEATGYTTMKGKGERRGEEESEGVVRGERALPRGGCEEERAKADAASDGVTIAIFPHQLSVRSPMHQSKTSVRWFLSLSLSLSHTHTPLMEIESVSETQRQTSKYVLYQRFIFRRRRKKEGRRRRREGRARYSKDQIDHSSENVEWGREKRREERKSKEEEEGERVSQHPRRRKTPEKIRKVATNIRCYQWRGCPTRARDGARRRDRVGGREKKLWDKKDARSENPRLLKEMGAKNVI